MEHILVLRILYLFYRTYSCISDLIRVLRNLYMYFRSYTCLTEHILFLRILYLHYGICTCLTDLIRSLLVYNRTRRYYTDSLYGSTRRYDWTYTYITELILIFPIREYPWVLQRLLRYRSTSRYYRTDTEVHSDLYSYSLFSVLSYVYLTT